MRLGRLISLGTLAFLVIVGCKKDPAAKPKRPFGRTIALHEAADTGDLEQVRRLLADGADVDVASRYGTTALYLAVQSHHGDVVKLLLAHGANVNATKKNGYTPLLAAAGGQEETVRLLIAHGADVNAKDQSSKTPLHRAALGGNMEIVRQLVAANADVHARDYLGRTPLYWALDVRYLDVRHSEVAQFLIAKGARADDRDKDGRTVLHMIVERGQKDTVELLMAKGANVGVVDSDGNTCLHLAAIKGQVAVAEALIGRMENINVVNARGHTPLHSAVLNTDAGGRDAMVMLLIAKGADVNARTNSGWTPLHFAARGGHVRAAELLLANGGEVNTTIGAGFTPLHTALRHRRYSVAELLILKGADTKAKNMHGKLPFDYASDDHREKLVGLIEGRFGVDIASGNEDTVSATADTNIAVVQTPEVPKTNVEKLVQGNTAFACDLYGKLRSQEGNLIFSPYSVSTALAMTYAAAREDTEKEMAQTLHFPLSQSDLHPAFAQLQRHLDEVQQAGNVRLCAANSLWPQLGEPFLPDYLTLVKQHYGVSITPVDYQTKQARQRTCGTINRCVEEKTEDRIRDLLQPGHLTELTRLILVNAIYFKGRWEEEFDPSLTKPGPFFVSGSQCVDVPMMSQEEGFRYAELESLEVLELPYRGGELSMLILLPKRIEGLDRLEARLSADQLTRWRASLEKERVLVFLPKFKMTFGVHLRGCLMAMGMVEAFTYPGANFAGLDGDPDGFYIGQVIHKAFIDVNEEGTEAAAATAVGVYAGSPPSPPVFRADHPFLYLIQDNRTGIVLFMGRVTNPTVEESTG